MMQGDITSNWNSRINIVHEVYARIKNEMDRYGYQKSDILKVFHLIDTDGAFISDHHVCVHSGEDVVYTLEEILCPSVERILTRNERKKNAVMNLKSRSVIGGIPYRLLFLSRNMEHVLYDRADTMSRDEKIQLADSFSDRYSSDTEGFKKMICSNNFAVEGTYADTWKFIMKDQNSLKRYSNLHLILEEEEICETRIDRSENEA